MNSSTVEVCPGVSHPLRGGTRTRHVGPGTHAGTRLYDEVVRQFSHVNQSGCEVCPGVSQACPGHGPSECVRVSPPLRGGHGTRLGTPPTTVTGSRAKGRAFHQHTAARNRPTGQPTTPAKGWVAELGDEPQPRARAWERPTGRLLASQLRASSGAKARAFARMKGWE